jgi:hypothetical protein
MIDRDLLREFPNQRIKPEDGMAVTASAWEAAHEYHRQRLRFHDLLRHGPGILTGLGVIASDPPDSTVYILPGVAADPCGETIVLTEPQAYDIGSAGGLVYLLLTYEESIPGVEPGHEDEPIFVDCQFGIEATSILPDDPYVELARILRKGADTPLTDASDALHPAPNEIDLRYRPEMSVSPLASVSIAVSYTGGVSSRAHGRGVDHLARALRQSGYRAAVDDGVLLTATLDHYTLLYLVGQEAFQLGRDEMLALHAYLEGGGCVLFESCRHDAAGADPPADGSILDLLASMGVELKELHANHDLLLKPHLFAAPPPGFETEGTPGVQVGNGVIFSTCDYGCLWGGRRRDRVASREEIRSAMEWGSNIIAFAVRRHQGKGKV